MDDLGLTGRLARWSARRRWPVVIVWFVGVAGVVVLSAFAGGVFVNDIDFLDGRDSQVAKDRLEEVRGKEPLVEQVVVQSSTVTTDSDEFRSFVQEVTADLRALTAHVEFAVSPYDAGAVTLFSADGSAAIIQAKVAGDIEDIADHLPPIFEVIEERDGEGGFTVATFGFGSFNQTFNDLALEDLETELLAIPPAFIVLILVFGAVVAALVPMVLALLAIMLSVALATLLADAFPLQFFIQNMIFMLGLALGIDYALFIVARFREERRRGLERIDAIAASGNTAARAVLFSGGAVVISLLGLMIIPNTIFRALAIGTIFAAVASVAVALTLLPAVIALLGDNINRLSVPFFSRGRARDEERGFWAGWARLVMAHPWPGVIGASALMLALAAPVLAISLGFSGVSTLPEDETVVRAFRILDEQFSAGRSQPTEIVVLAEDVTRPEITAAIERLDAAVAGDREIVLNPSLTDGVNAAGDLFLRTVSLPGNANAPIALDALERLLTDVIPPAFEGVSGIEVVVGGQTAISRDFTNQMTRSVPLVIGFVLVLSFVLLLLVFRSVIVPLKAIVMNLFSVAAAYGALVFVFQDIGPNILGFSKVETIESWLPLMLFAILFGLSMDYHVFLLSRIRESYDGSGDNAASVEHGLRTTANIITGAAAIMLIVFGGFALGQTVALQQMGFGLAVAVFLDATVMRMVLVPSAMELLGDWNWYLPRWLEWLPDLRVEGSRPGAVATPSAPAAAGG